MFKSTHSSNVVDDLDQSLGNLLSSLCNNALTTCIHLISNSTWLGWLLSASVNLTAEILWIHTKYEINVMPLDQLNCKKCHQKIIYTKYEQFYSLISLGRLWPKGAVKNISWSGPKVHWREYFWQLLRVIPSDINEYKTVHICYIIFQP